MEENNLLTYGTWSGWNGGSFIDYVITKDSTISVVINLAGTNFTITDILTPDEYEMINNFIKNEVDGKDYESQTVMDAGSFIYAGGRKFENAMKLNEKFGEVLAKIIENHPIISRQNIDTICGMLSESHKFKMDRLIANRKKLSPKSLSEMLDMIEQGNISLDGDNFIYGDSFDTSSVPKNIEELVQMIGNGSLELNIRNLVNRSNKKELDEMFGNEEVKEGETPLVF